MKPPDLSLEEFRNYLIRYHHLTAATDLAGPEEQIGYVKKVGCIQFDPLDVVGRNPDLVLQARSARYRRGEIAGLIYDRRALFDVWDKNMSIAAVEDWPCFHRFRARYREFMHEYADEIASVKRGLAAMGSACSSDFDLNHKIPWWYGDQRMAKAALECLCYAGQAVVHHKKGTRRYYAPAAEWISPELYQAPDPHPDDEAYHQWQVLRRINAIGALWNRTGDAWLGIHDFKAEHRNRAFRALLEQKRIAEIHVEGFGQPFYIDSRNLDALATAAAPVEEDACRFLAPLDNLLWDRRLIKEVFGFHYRWEVYVPAAQRQWGYYVLPVLWENRLMGRIEFDNCRSGPLTVKQFWPEEHVRMGRVEKAALRRGLQRFAAYLGKEPPRLF